VREKEKEKGISTVLESTYRQANDTTAACKKELFYSRERLVKALFSFFFFPYGRAQGIIVATL